MASELRDSNTGFKSEDSEDVSYFWLLHICYCAHINRYSASANRSVNARENAPANLHRCSTVRDALVEQGRILVRIR